MIIFLYGQNSYGLIQYVNQLISRYQKKYPDSFNLHRFDLEEENPDEVKNVLKGVSFFGDVKFVIVKNPLTKTEIIEKVIKETNVAEQKETVLLLYQTISDEELKTKYKKFFEFLEKSGEVKEFKPLTSQAATKFAANELVKNKISLNRELLAKLIKESGSDLWRLKNELDKLAGFMKEEKKRALSEEEFLKLIEFKIDQNIFNIVDAAFSNQPKALILFENYLNDGGDEFYLLSMLAFQVKSMLIIRELLDNNLQYGQILKKTRMHPFFFKKIHEAAKNYKMEDLKNIFQKIADTEMALKTGQSERENIFFKIFL